MEGIKWHRVLSLEGQKVPWVKDQPHIPLDWIEDNDKGSSDSLLTSFGSSVECSQRKPEGKFLCERSGVLEETCLNRQRRKWKIEGSTGSSCGLALV